MPNNTCLTMSEMANELALQEGATYQSIRAGLDAFINAGPDVDAATVTEKIQQYFPDYTPPTDREERLKAHNIAKDRMSATFTNISLGKEKYDLGPNGRVFYALFKNENTPENIAYNQELARIIKSGTQEERLDLFREVMLRMRDVNANEIMKLNDYNLAIGFNSSYPVMKLAFERQNVIKAFQDMCEIPEEDLQMFNDLAKPLEAVSMEYMGRMDAISNPYYPDVDYDQFPAFEVEKYEQLENEFPFNGEAAGMIGAGAKINDSKTAYIKNNMNASLKEIFGVEDEFYFSSKPDGIKEEDYAVVSKHLLDLSNDKTIYAFPKGEENLPLEEKHVKAFRDFTGKGILTEVPNPVAKPSGFVRFFHNIFKGIGFSGFSSCNRYDEYVQTMEERKAQAIAEYEANNPETKYKEVYDKATKMQEERKILKAAIEEKAKFDKEQTLTDNCIEAIVGPNAHELKGYELMKNYTPEEYTPEKLDFQKGEPFSDKDITLIAFAGLADHKSLNACGKAQELPEDIRDIFLYVHVARDPMLNPRQHIGGYYESINEGRRTACEALRQYREGNKDALAKLLGNAVKLQTKYNNGSIGFDAHNARLANISNNMLELMDKDPELMEKSGLTKQDLLQVKAQKAHADIHQKGLDAKARLCEAQVNGITLTEDEKLDLITDILAKETAYKLEEAASSEEIKKHPDYEKYEAEIKQYLTLQDENRIISVPLKEGDPQKIELDKEYAKLGDDITIASKKQDALRSERPLSSFHKLLAADSKEQPNLKDFKAFLAKQPAVKNLLKLPQNELCKHMATPSATGKTVTSIIDSMHFKGAQEAIKEGPAKNIEASKNHADFDLQAKGFEI